MDRREFVGDLVRLAAIAAVVPNEWRVTRRTWFADDPFQLGVASGDPRSNGITLWTRLVPRPLEVGGGMTDQRVAVRWEVADDEAFSKIVKRGTATAAPELAHTVHVDVDGLAAHRWYYYRFMAGDAVSPVGRLRTAPAAGQAPPLRFAFASCQHYEQGLFTAYQHMAKEEDLDLVAHLGDYIYETAGVAGRVRLHATPEILTLDDYRRRYAQYKSDEHLRAAHAARPWILTWDDHEVRNNYANLVPPAPDSTMTTAAMRGRRGAAYQAWWEHQPVRLDQRKEWSDLNIARAVDWGGIARFSVIDTRQYRSDQACNDGSKVVPCGDWADSSRTVMGATQEKWLNDSLSGSRARWQVLANQIMVAPYDNLAGDDKRVSMDQWSGYPVARDRLLGEIARRAPNRTVVLTGDIHSNWVNEIKSSFSTPNAPTIAAEFVGTSISSGGDGNDRPLAPGIMAENPQVKWYQARRGYVTCSVTPDEWRAEYRTVTSVTTPDAPIVTSSAWRVRHGQPGIEKI